MKSVESNFIISAGDAVNKYFHRYPSPLVPAADTSKSVNVGSSTDTFPFKFVPLDPLSMHMYTLKSLFTT